MNPIEWLVYAAAWDVFHRSWLDYTPETLMASAQILAEGSRRGG